MSNQKHGSFVVMADINDAGKRLDAFVTANFPSISRSIASRLIQMGEITVGGSIKKPGYRLTPGDRVEGLIPELVPFHLKPEATCVPILFEDAAILVVNKPPGMVVHPSPGHEQGTLANWLLHHHPPIEKVGGDTTRPGIVHRLDQDTSGVLVVAKTEKTYIDMVLQFKERLVKKTYIGLVYGKIGTDCGQIVLPMGRHAENRKKMGISDSCNARYAETHWRIRQRFNRMALMEFDIKTGRTHQIRVHCAAINHPIVGDRVYGFKKPGRLFEGNALLKQLVQSIPRQMLHAWRLGIIHPETRENIQFEAPLPEDMSRVLSGIQGHEKTTESAPPISHPDGTDANPHQRS